MNEAEALRHLDDCLALAERFYDLSAIEFVVSPKNRGTIIVESVSQALSARFRTMVRPIVAFKGETAEKDFTFYADDLAYLRSGRRGLFVDDTLVTGGSFAAIRSRINDTGSTLLAAGFIRNRSGLGAADLGIHRLEALDGIRKD